MADDPHDTKGRILESAEELFADQGFAATSLRTVTSRAGVNLAAVHYHFGSKEALIEAVFSRRLGPINRERLEHLDALEQEPRSEHFLEHTVEAFIGPALRMAHEPGGPVFMRLFGHAISQPGTTRELFTRQFQEVFQRFTAAFRRALPHLPEAELEWRFLFMVGAMAHSMALSQDLERISAGLCHADDVEGTLSSLVGFVSAGLRSPVPTPTTGGA